MTHVPAPGEIEELVESGIQDYRHGRSSARLAMIVTEHLELLLNHPDFSEDILYWKHCQYYRLAKQWRWIASRKRSCGEPFSSELFADKLKK